MTIAVLRMGWMSINKRNEVKRGSKKLFTSCVTVRQKDRRQARN